MDALTALVDFFALPLQFAFVQRALLVAVVAGLVCTVLSCWGWSLMGDAVSHAVLPGVVLSFMFGLPFAVGALVFGAGSVALIGAVNRTSRVKEDAVIGVVFTAMFALGLVLISRVPSQTDLSHILFGNVLGVSKTDIAQILALAVLVLALIWYKHRDLTLYAFDPVHAHAIGLNPHLLETLLLGLLARTVVIALQAVGIILVVAMVIIPGATAYLLTDRFETMLAIASSLAVAAAVLGVLTSFHLNISTGGSIVLTQAGAFALAYLFSPRHGLLTRRRRARARARAPEATTARKSRHKIGGSTAQRSRCSPQGQDQSHSERDGPPELVPEHLAHVLPGRGAHGHSDQNAQGQSLQEARLPAQEQAHGPPHCHRHVDAHEDLVRHRIGHSRFPGGPAQHSRGPEEEPRAGEGQSGVALAGGSLLCRGSHTYGLP